MSLDSFKSLMEVQSLDKKIGIHLDHIREHEKRVTFLNSNREKKNNEKDQLTSKLNDQSSDIACLEKDLFKFENEIERAKVHLLNASTNNQVLLLEKEISNLSPRAEKLEEEILQKMDDNEDIEKEIEKITTFIDGSKSTLTEIKQEVEKDCQKEALEISRYQDRIDLLLEPLDDKYKKPFIDLNKKFRFNSPLAMIVGGACSSCRFQVTGVQKEQVEQGRVLEFCAGCNRLLTPYNAKGL